MPIEYIKHAIVIFEKEAQILIYYICNIDKILMGF